MFRWLIRKTYLTSSLLGSIPSLLYVLIYFSLIPMFACIYSLYPSHFYYATAPYDFKIRQSVQPVFDQVRVALVDEFTSVNHTDHFDCGDKTYNLDSLTVSGGTMPDDERQFLYMSIGISGKAIGEHPEEEVLTSQSFVRIPLSFSYDYDDPNDELPSIFRFNYISKSHYHLPIEPVRSYGTPKNLLDILCSKNERYHRLWFEDQLVVPAPKETTRLIRQYRQAISGQSLDGGDWGRMFYFSTVTITTIGYGDIVPVTTRTRVLVGLEAISGILLVGLFLNALAHEQNPSEALLLALETSKKSETDSSSQRDVRYDY